MVNCFSSHWREKIDHQLRDKNKKIYPLGSLKLRKNPLKIKRHFLKNMQVVYLKLFILYKEIKSNHTCKGMIKLTLF
ncbi:hypothetical protein NEOC65_001656 [Neochlamydia sp. AcF65]|nr:hypothetical protein [Neochlamydia sp. AcF65]MBS4170470.1 hypothetical protein [Neochlamydia sp. AcF95]NGY95399.1 hypothetical protein [Neochlamydia sp. AcF84]